MSFDIVYQEIWTLRSSNHTEKSEIGFSPKKLIYKSFTTLAKLALLGKMKVFLILLLVAVIGVDSQDDKYTDWMGRHRWYPVADIIDTDHPEHCLEGCFKSFEFRRRLLVFCDMWGAEGNQTYSQNATCAASSLAADDDRAIYLSFRGTRSPAQMGEENRKS